jgi:hypothetical protein
MKLSKVPSEVLLSNTIILAQKERELSLDVLRHLREIERRSLYAERGYSTLFEYAVQELKYSQGAAHRRIASMRLLKDIPEMEEKLELGEMTLSTLARAQTFFRQEKAHVKSREYKIEILKVLENKSAREVERELVCRSSKPEKLIPDRLRPVSETHTELKVLLDADTLRELEELKDLLSHARPNATLRELLKFALQETLTRLRPRPPQARSQSKPKAAPHTPLRVAERAPFPTSKTQDTPPRKPSRYIPTEVKRVVWQRDRGKCSYIDPLTGKHCDSKHSLEYDHIYPAALGGESSEENLRLRCRTHNQLEALSIYGHQKMAKFVPRMS